MITKYVELQRKLKKQKGITLIALIITIILLLILAGVTIKILSQGNMLEKTTQATNKYKEEVAKEEIKIAWSAITAEYYDKYLKDTNIKRIDCYTKDNLNENLKNTGEITEFEYNEGGITTLTYVKPNKDNIREEYYMEIETNGEVKIVKKVPINEGTIEFKTVEWKEQKASVEMTTNCVYKIQYQVNSQEDDGWIIGNKASELNLHDTVYVRLWDGKEAGNTVSKIIEDEELPNDAKIEFSTTSTNIISKITAHIELTDDQSGVNIQACKWEYTTTSDNVGTDPNNYTGGTFTENIQDIKLKATVEGLYYLHILTIDNAGNAKETISTQAITVETAELPGKPDASGIFTENSTKDGEDPTAFNPEIPKGFKPVDVGNAKWDDENGYKKGLVIQDAEGNQFVWIAVDGNVVKLNRYNFATGSWGGSVAGVPIGDGAFFGVFEELENSSYDNTSARDLKGFKNSVNEHGGYYMARFEANKGSDGLPDSKSGAVWTNISQPSAADVSRRMYSEAYGAYSDLVNSYAWDTAIIFIQAYSGNTSYSQAGVNTNYGASMLTGTHNDQVCNIHDMAANHHEWTTETYNYTSSHAVWRSNYSNGTGSRFTGYRGTSKVNDVTAPYAYGFRVCLYLK